MAGKSAISTARVPYNRYAVNYNQGWNCWYVEDTFKGRDVADCEFREDAEAIVECLNLIEYESNG